MNLSLDYFSEANQRRFQGFSKKDPLMQAVGKSKLIWDMTGGFGIDAMSLAHSGLSIKISEVNILVYMILYEALEAYLTKVSLHISLEFGEAKDILTSTKVFEAPNLGEPREFQPEVIYFDFMFESTNSAKSKKNMEFLKALLPLSPRLQQEELIQMALEKCLKSVVLKSKEGGLSLKKPSHIYKAKSFRYDVFLK